MTGLAIVLLALAFISLVLAMSYSMAGFLGMLDLEKLQNRREQLVRVFDLICLSGLIWIFQSFRKNWSSRADERISLITGVVCGAIAITLLVAAIVFVRTS